MTALAKPALGATAMDAQFGTTFRRITAVAGTGASAAIVPMYSTISAWNADESPNTGKVCRVGRHRSWGKANAVLGYWPKPTPSRSPSGTRAVFASDWGGGASVDSYVLELPTYAP